MSTTTTEENKELVHEYLDAWDAADPSAIAGPLADDFSTTFTDPSGEEVTVDVEGLQEMMAGYFEVFAELGHEIHETVAEDDRVMARITYSGVHEGEFLGVEATGNRVEVEEYLSFRIEDGEIVEYHWLGDNLALLRQLGAELPFEY